VKSNVEMFDSLVLFLRTLLKQVKISILIVCFISFISN